MNISVWNINNILADKNIHKPSKYPVIIGSLLMLLKKCLFAFYVACKEFIEKVQI